MINRIKHRLDFFHRLVAPNKHEAKTALNGPGFLDSIISEQLHELLVIGGGQVFNQHEPLDATNTNLLMPAVLSCVDGEGMDVFLFLRIARRNCLVHSLMMMGGGLCTPSFIDGLPTR